MSENRLFNARTFYLVGAAAAVVVVGVLALLPSSFEGLSDDVEVSFEEAFAIIQKRCVPCHSSEPTMSGFSEPPKGIIFDTEEGVRARTADIMRVAVRSTFMPLANRTKISAEERARIGRWIERGAK